MIYRSVEELKGDMARMELSILEAQQDNLRCLQDVSSRLQNFERNMEKRNQERDLYMLETEGRKASNYLNKFSASCDDVRSLDLANDCCQNILANRPRSDTLDVHFTAGVVAVATTYAKHVQLSSAATAKKTVFDGEVRNISKSLKPIWADSSAVLTSTWNQVVVYLLDIASSICILPPEGVLLSPLDSQLVEAFGILCASQPSLLDRFPEIGGAALRTLLQAKTLKELFHASNALNVDTSRCDNKADLIQGLLDEGKQLHAALNADTKTDHSHRSSGGNMKVWSSMAPPIVVAIDFGTTRSAYAYMVEGEASGKILVRVPDSALASPSSSVKTETAALLNRKGRGDLIAFGLAARDQCAYQDHDEEDAALFRWFKLDLCKTGQGQTSVERVMTKSSSGRHTVPLFHVIKTSLIYFKDDVLRFLSSTRGRDVDAKEVTWVITVPAIYDDFAKRFMREAAHGAGMIDRVDSVRLRLCLEPEAACLAVTTDDNPLTCEAEGKNMMIVDCGGGTVDITAYKILSVDPLKLAEVTAPDGGIWGSTRVDNAFEELLKILLGSWMDEVSDETYLSIMMTWERTKAEFTGQDSSQSLRLDLSELSNSGLTREDMEELRTRYNSSRSAPHQVKGRLFMVTLPATLVSTLFTPTIEKIAQCLRKITGMSSLRNLDRVYLVGGFSRSPLVKSMAREELQRFSGCVVDVHEPDLAIVRGAVMYPTMSTVFNSSEA
ncbi:unnamed protein product [Ectocarpus fasciculatus]